MVTYFCIGIERLLRPFSTPFADTFEVKTSTVPYDTYFRNMEAFTFRVIIEAAGFEKRWRYITLEVIFIQNARNAVCHHSRFVQTLLAEVYSLPKVIS